MERTTRKQLEGMVTLLNLRLNRPTDELQVVDGKTLGCPGHLKLDYAPEYGGYCIMEMEEHGERHPMTATRVNAQTMWFMLHALIQAVFSEEFKKYKFKKRK